MLPVAGPGIKAGIRVVSGSFLGGQCRQGCSPRALREGAAASVEDVLPTKALLERLSLRKSLMVAILLFLNLQNAVRLRLQLCSPLLLLLLLA